MRRTIFQEVQICFSVQVDRDIKKLSRRYGAQIAIPETSPILRASEDIRVYPHGQFPVMIMAEHGREIRSMNYSLIPHWSKVKKPKFATYNARVESITEKPTWRDPLKTHRCIVGINSFFENCHEGTHKGFQVQFKSDDFWTIAGLWSEWVDKENGEIVESFAIITTKPTQFIEEIGHDRSPIFLNEKCIVSWLDPAMQDSANAIQVLRENYLPLNQAVVENVRKLKVS